MLCPSIQGSSKRRKDAVMPFYGNEGIHFQFEIFSNDLSVNAVMLKPLKRCGKSVFSNSEASMHIVEPSAMNGCHNGQTVGSRG